MAPKKKETEEGEVAPAAKTATGDQPKAKAKAKPKAEPKADAADAAAPPPKVKAKAKPKADAGEPKAKAEAPSKAEPSAGGATAKAKAKAGGEAKAEAKASTGAEPKAKAEGKAKAKATAKAEAPGAAAEPKAKASAKAEVAKPKAKGEAKAVAKATAKAKEAPPAAAAAPATAEPAEAADAGMEAVTRKRRNRKKKSESEEPLAPEEELAQTGPTDADLADSERIKSERDTHHNNLYEKIRKDLDALPDLNLRATEDVTKEVAEQRRELEKIMAEVDETLRGVKISRPKNVNTSKIMEQMRELRICKNDDGTFTEETKKQMLDDLDKALSKSLGWESFKNFQTTMQSLKARCEERAKQNEVLAKAARSGNLQRKIVQRVAASKGVRAEELKEDSVVSLQVDLPPDVTAMSFLYRPKFEKQFGVIIDRPDGAKGSGKGPVPPPKSLIVRGIEPDVTSCIKDLKALDLSDRKSLKVTAKQASIIMGPQQSNARRLESEFRSVLINSESNQVTVYGPAKEVQACLASIKAMMPEEGSAPAAGSAATAVGVPTMTIDKDKARALIGANGKNVQKIETDTNTKIKVNIIRSDEEEVPATVKITGDKANQDKARDQINAFLKSLASCLVEADSDIVSRLYDSAVKGKGKSKGKGAGEGRPSRFGDLRDNSGLTVVKKAKGILLVGEKESVDKWKVTLQECVQEAAHMPTSIKLTFEQAKLWTTERVEAVQNTTGAKLQLSKRGRDTSLEILGGEEEKEKAKEEVQKIHNDLGWAETIENVSADGVRSLTAKGAGRVREVEQAHDVSIAVDRKLQVVRIVGAKTSVEEARKIVESVLDSAATNTSREVEIGQYEGRVIIGKGGTTVRQIKQATGLDDLQVEDGDGQTKKVVLRGSEEAVDAAEKKVKEVLAKARDPASAAEAATPAKESGAETAAEPPATTAAEKPAVEEKPASAKEPAETAADTEAKQEAPRKGKGKGSRPDVNLESTELFPTLSSNSGGAGGKKAKRQPKTAWNKAQEDDDGEEEEEEETAAEETAAAQDASAEGGDEEAEGGAEEAG